ncbi:MAG: hypothetical protein LUF04_12985, partial [Bacteroides sp.]|nr:hypothetical protein [Bacteroides sp.]
IGCQQQEDLTGSQPGNTDGSNSPTTRTVFSLDTIGLPAFDPTGATDIRDVTGTLQPGQTYIINGEYSGNIPYTGSDSDERVIVFVAGTWVVGNWNFENGVDVVVLPGGKLLSTENSSLVINGNSNVFVLPGGEANFTNDFFYFSNTGNLYVFGNLTADFIEMNAGSLLAVGPEGTLTADTFDLRDVDASIEGNLFVRNSVLIEGSRAYNVQERVYNPLYILGQSVYVLDLFNPLGQFNTTPDADGKGASLYVENNVLKVSVPANLDIDDLPQVYTFLVRERNSDTITARVTVIFR